MLSLERGNVLKWPCVCLATLSAAGDPLCAQNLIRASLLLLTAAFISDQLFSTGGNET